VTVVAYNAFDAQAGAEMTCVHLVAMQATSVCVSIHLHTHAHIHKNTDIYIYIYIYIHICMIRSRYAPVQVKQGRYQYLRASSFVRKVLLHVQEMLLQVQGTAHTSINFARIKVHISEFQSSLIKNSDAHKHARVYTRTLSLSQHSPHKQVNLLNIRKIISCTRIMYRTVAGVL
jgi:hypothetical protein